jgi:hypothetical protein
MMDGPASVEQLVVSARVDHQRAEQFALLGHDPHLRTSHEDVDRRVAVSRSNADVSQPAAVAQGDGAGLVDAIVTDAVLEASSALGPALTRAATVWVVVRPSSARWGRDPL